MMQVGWPLSVLYYNMQYYGIIIADGLRCKQHFNVVAGQAANFNYYIVHICIYTIYIHTHILL